MSLPFRCHPGVSRPDGHIATTDGNVARGQQRGISIAISIGLLTIGLTACVSGNDATGSSATPLLTLDGKPPMVFGHRGLPGLLPEETGPSYELAADMGADALEQDLHLTRDCQLAVRHNPWLSDNTNIKEVAARNPDFAARQRTAKGVMVKVPWPTTPGSGPAEYLSDRINPADQKSVLKALIVDGEDHTNDWSISDFTMAELATIGGTTYDAANERPASHNGKYPIISFQQVIDIARAKGRSTGRTLYLYPETKNPTWNNQQGIANGCDRAGTGHPLEDTLLKALEANGLNSREAPIFVQSFEPGSLKYLRSRGMQARAVQLIDGHGINYRTGEVVLDNITASRPYDWTVNGDARWFSAMVTPEGLAQIKTYADGIGPWKAYIVGLKVTPWRTTNADGTAFVASASTATTQPAGTLITDAHRAGLFVHAFTFRNEKRYLAADYNGDPLAEYRLFYRLGIDGVFTDFTPTAVAARSAFLRETGR